MMMSLARPLPAAVALLAVLLAGCGGGEPDAASDEPPSASGAEEVAEDAPEEDVPVEAEPVDAGDAEDGAEATAPSDDQPAATDNDVDLDTPPEPDPDARAEDFPDFEWAFEEGHYAGSYGRSDYYEPSTVSEQGSFAGLSATEAYRAGFALGLAEYEAQIAAAEEASASAEAEAEANYPVGHLIEGWNPQTAVSEFWEIPEAASCQTAAASDPCLDVWYSENNTVITALGRLDPSVGAEPDHALRLSATMRGYEVQEAWSTLDDPAVALPEWAQRTG